MSCSQEACLTAERAEGGPCGVSSLRQEELTGEGWERRATLNEPRLSETVEMYGRLGFQVHLEPFDLESGNEQGCAECFQDPALAASFKTIFTRKTGSGPEPHPQ